MQEKPKRLHELHERQDAKGGEGDFPIRDIENLFCSSITIDCALKEGCIPCAYKVCCFDVALDSSFCSVVPNQRPENCPRSREAYTNDGETLGYKQGIRVLTVGDGDFSFSLALARLLLKHGRRGHDNDGPVLVATSYESKDTLQQVYTNFDKTLLELEDLGAMVCFNVDATHLSETLPPSLKAMKFDRVVWNFPCSAISKGQDGQNDAMEFNKQLVRDFVSDSYRLVSHLGEIQMCHKTKPPFNHWSIEKVAVELCNGVSGKQNVCYEGRVVLDRCLLPPYQPRKALHAKSFPCHDACMYIFRVMDSIRASKSQQSILAEKAIQYEYPCDRTTWSPGLVPVSRKLINSIREKLISQAMASSRTSGGQRKKKRKR